jgi:hypothetical protein
VRGGSDQIQIQLHPAELGSIEVRLHVARDGAVTAIIAAERHDTLALLQGEARGLEQALRDAGLRADSGSLSFGPRGDAPFDQRGFDRQPGQGTPRFATPPPPDAAPREELRAATPAARPASRYGGALDIRV